MCYFSLKIPRWSILSSCYCTWCFCACSCGFPQGSYLTDGLALINCLPVWTLWCVQYLVSCIGLASQCIPALRPAFPGLSRVQIHFGPITRRECWSKITNVMVMYCIVLHGWLNHPDRYFWYLYNLPTISEYLGYLKKKKQNLFFFIML